MWLPNVGDMVLIDSSAEKYQVFRCSCNDGVVKLGAIATLTNDAYNFVYDREEFTERVRPAPSLAQLLKDSTSRLGASQFRLAMEALRLRHAHLIDPFHAINASQIDLLPHQADAVYRHMLPQPRIRFMLADDPGLGKTIMAGLVIKELKARGAADRILIVVPAHLKDQWQREMADRFDEDFTIFDDPRSMKSKQFLDLHPQIITSIDFAKREPKRSFLANGDVSWDIAIFDEAHKLSARVKGGEIDPTQKYQFAKHIESITNHMLFLTATPHNGYHDEYLLRLDLLEPGMFSGMAQVGATLQQYQKIPFVLRRSKEHVTDLKGNPLFKRRTVNTLALEMSGAGRRLYDAVTEYVHNWYPSTANLESGAEKIRRYNIALALTVLQRRVTSGSAATRLSLERRRQKLAVLRSQWEKHLVTQSSLLESMTAEDVQDLDDRLTAEWDDLQDLIESTTAAADLEELKEEIGDLTDLIKVVKNIEATEDEPKLDELRNVIDAWLRGRPEEKLLIFSEFKDTVLALKSHLEQFGLTVAMIHGGMTMSQRTKQEQRFRDEAQVMVATDAAAEGINLQFCRLMINYDLPWNPNRLEQRMGRIHRYGQDRDCFIWNLLYDDTREGRILTLLMAKIEAMKDRPELGDSIYDVVSTVLSGIPLEQLIMEAVMTGNTAEIERVIDINLEDRVNDYIKLLKENALAANYINLAEVQSLNERSEREDVNGDIERFVKQATEWMGGGLDDDPLRGEGVRILGIPTTKQADYRDAGYESGLRVALDRQVAKRYDIPYLTIGNPILDRMIEKFSLDDHQPRISILRDDEGPSGLFCVYRLGVQDGHRRSAAERLAAVFCRPSGKSSVVDVRIARRMCNANGQAEHPIYVHLEMLEERASSAVMSQLTEMRSEVLAQRSRQADVKRRWLDRSYSLMIYLLQAQLDYLRKRVDQGETNLTGLVVIRENRLANVQRQRDARLADLDKEVELTQLEPKLEALALVIGID